MNNNFKNTALRDLLALQSKLEKEINDRAHVEFIKLVEATANTINESGFSMDRFITEISKKKYRQNPQSVIAKYRNPNNSDETWSGRGKKPKWIIKLEKSGHNLEQLLIKH